MMLNFGPDFVSYHFDLNIFHKNVEVPNLPGWLICFQASRANLNHIKNLHFMLEAS